VNLYELLRKLIRGDHFYPEDTEAALNLVQKMEQLNAFGSVALYTGDHVCQGEVIRVEVPNTSAFRGKAYIPPEYKTIKRCVECKREMEM
jgi:hypothetical protein